jgi:hypothetical protein
MTELTWQKSSYSEEASSCIYLATASAAGTVLLRESDEPQRILTTDKHSLAALITTLRTPPN